MEAAANGLPLLCRKDPCLDEILQNGKNGFEYTTEEEFLEKLNGILTDESWHSEAKQASERAAEPFDKSNFAAAVESVYLAALAPKPNATKTKAKPNATKNKTKPNAKKTKNDKNA